MARANGTQRYSRCFGIPFVPGYMDICFEHNNTLLQNRFTGWVDSNLADKGVAEAHHAATLLRDGGFTFDRV